MAAAPCERTATAAALAGRGLSLPASPTCAVVGSSDILRLVPRGAEIDGHALVWRLNNAPTRGWEEQVGRRTSLRLVNHVPIEKWLLRARNRSALRRTVDGAEYEELLCAPAALERACLVSLQGRGQGFGAKLEAYRDAHAPHRLVVMSEALLRYGGRCSTELRGNAPSSGLFAVLLALAVCAPPVDLYGFWPFCCKPHRGWPAMNYKYSQGNRTRWVCCSRGREKMEVEYGFYESLARRRLVRLR